MLSGILIKHGSRLKNEASAKMDTLLSRLYTLETAHKSSQLDSHIRDLLHTRHEILQLLEHKQNHFQQLCTSSFYEWNNKSGKLLACALRDKWTTVMAVLEEFTFLSTIFPSLGPLTHLSTWKSTFQPTQKKLMILISLHYYQLFSETGLNRTGKTSHG